MLMCLSNREVDSPKDRVTKRNKAVADGGSDTTAVKAKKPKSQGGESVTFILADVPLEENERSQGCFGEGPYHLDSLKAFQNKMDLDRYAKMEDWEFEEQLRVQAGDLMSSLDTLKNFQIHMDPDRYAKIEELKFEEQLRVQDGALMTDVFSGHHEGPSKCGQETERPAKCRSGEAKENCRH
ncbi:hypothetical protein POM88_036442 [Heracleum sosnowskyi]|uniref:Uncharacterized protein n=1 Tax=Heracleum sosnowskyi TaxID=360622 RepID=A0AAD8MCD3_9APIA|nr:hypothetical protein POM88_036442 [Heracleum sosnowskyi]